tara:strand:- start:1674 stop:2750 length:1077 start_codon:yes stop_codon:yes gene_type:complete
MDLFSIAKDTLNYNSIINFDLFINSSSVKESHFVCIHNAGKVFTKSQFDNFYRKVENFYVKETDRSKYLDSLTNNNKSLKEKARVIKDLALSSLENLFETKVDDPSAIVHAVDNCFDAAKTIAQMAKNTSIGDLHSLLGELNFHDHYTFDHSINVGMYNVSILKALKPNASEDELVTASLAGILHDIGKMKIPNKILNNIGKLSDKDFLKIKQHPLLGEALLRPLKFKFKDKSLESIIRVVLEHHENIDGSGYPYGLKSNEISLLSKITAISDFFDAVTTKRSYQKTWTIPEALSLMSTTIGKKIDPDIFLAFIDSLNAEVKDNLDIEIDMDYDFGSGLERFKLKRKNKIIDEKRKIS